MNSNTLECQNLSLDNVIIGGEPPNYPGYKRHTHSYWEINVCSVEDENYLLLQPPSVAHYMADKKELNCGWNLHCQEPLMSLSFYDNPSRTLLSWKEIDDLCPGGFSLFLGAIVHSKENNDQRLFNNLNNTLWTIVFRVWKNGENIIPSLSPSVIARDYIEANYCDANLSVDSVATYLGITPGYLAKIFKREQLPTVRQYIVQVRMEHAMRLLQSRRYKVKEVALMTGWNCQFYFSSCFQKYFGFPPSHAANEISDYMFES